MKHKNFTFVELVFTLTVLAVTALLMLSSLTHVREQAQSVLCLKQMSELGKLALSYNETYKCIAINPKWNTGKRVVTTTYLYMYWRLGLIKAEEAKGSPGNTFLDKKFFCPALLARNNTSMKKIGGKEYYSSNCTYGVRRDTRTVYEGIKNHWKSDYFNLNKLNSPAKFNFYGCASRRTTRRPIRSYYSRIAAGNIDFLTGVHGGKAAVWTMDGKTELITASDLENRFGGNKRCWNH